MNITKNIFYVGVNDRQKALFEGLWPLPNGVSYNSYLIVDEKVCLIDTVEVTFFSQFLENVRTVIGERPIDYVVINHMEPDHSGSLALLRKYYPEVQIVGNKKTFQMMQGFYKIGEEGAQEVKNGDSIALPTGRWDWRRGAILGRCLRLLWCSQRWCYRRANQLRYVLAGDGALLLEHRRQVWHASAAGTEEAGRATC